MALKEKALRRLAEKLNAAGITWGIGAGWLLCYHGVTDTYHDFDLMAAQADAAQADKVLTRLGMRSPAADAGDAFHCAYHFDGADVDLMAGAVIGGQYHMRFDASSIAGTAEVLGAQVPLMYLEDWYVYYARMGRDSRAAALERHFAAHPPAHPERFALAVAEPLPAPLQAKIDEMMGACQQ